MTDEVREDRPYLVRITIAGQAGWTLWFDGDPALLLAREGRVMLFSSPDALTAAIAKGPWTFSPASVVDFDAAAAWMASPDREVTTDGCDNALNALNMAIDVGATVGDHRLADLVASAALGDVYDAVTFGLTLLGDGSPYRDDPAAMIAAITPASAEAMGELVAMVSGHMHLEE